MLDVLHMHLLQLLRVRSKLWVLVLLVDVLVLCRFYTRKFGIRKIPRFFLTNAIKAVKIYLGNKILDDNCRWWCRYILKPFTFLNFLLLRRPVCCQSELPTILRSNWSGILKFCLTVNLQTCKVL